MPSIISDKVSSALIGRLSRETTCLYQFCALVSVSAPCENAICQKVRWQDTELSMFVASLSPAVGRRYCAAGLSAVSVMIKVRC